MDPVEATEPDSKWIPCQFLRHAGRNACIIRLNDTGTIVQIGLRCAIDVTRACMICALKPIPARIQWGEGGALEACELDIQWPAVPAPCRFNRKRVCKPVKRQRT